MADRFEFSVQLTAEEHREGLRWWFGHDPMTQRVLVSHMWRGRALVVTVFSVAVAGGFVLINRGESDVQTQWLWGFVLAIFALLLIAAAYRWPTRARMIEHQVAQAAQYQAAAPPGQRPTDPRTIVADAAGLHTRTPHVASSQDWSCLAEIAEAGGLVVLRLRQGITVIPRRVFATPAEAAAFVEQCRRWKQAAAAEPGGAASPVEPRSGDSAV